MDTFVHTLFADEILGNFILEYIRPSFLEEVILLKSILSTFLLRIVSGLHSVLFPCGLVLFSEIERCLILTHYSAAQFNLLIALCASSIICCLSVDCCK
ncbi:hypothetical protein DICVIV_06483 [Dictyocaulus viviparus]|uniref:Uncharacterized protein n=1 Tax=Dictyocaulus viviparus TaxID=29172 RepID=A0A0D8XUF1_DICVI|nr:hypothetical protein DICVIV_06483 [Dictyocaulus viviparus]